MSREAALLGLLADLATDRDALIAQRDALKAENDQLRQALNEATAPTNPGFEVDDTPGHPGVAI